MKSVRELWLVRLAFLLGLAGVLAGCGGSDGGGAATGTLSVGITDAPVDDAEHVYIQFAGLELHAASGERTMLYYCEDPQNPGQTVISTSACATPKPRQLDLKMLTDGQTDLLLNDYTLPAGHYNWIRLLVETAGTLDSYIVPLGGGEFELTIPSDAETGLKLNRGFDVPAGGQADFTIDFDLRKSVHLTEMGEYVLRPTLRMVDNSMVGSIGGTVAKELVTAGCTPAVYVFSGSNVTPDDIDQIAPEPVTTAMVKLDGTAGEFRYNAAFLEAGDYTVAFTCNAAADDPSKDGANGASSTVTFSGAANVVVSPKTVTMHDF